jgi:hypothetical protein
LQKQAIRLTQTLSARRMRRFLRPGGLRARAGTRKKSEPTPAIYGDGSTSTAAAAAALNQMKNPTRRLRSTEVLQEWVLGLTYTLGAAGLWIVCLTGAATRGAADAASRLRLG